MRQSDGSNSESLDARDDPHCPNSGTLSITELPAWPTRYLNESVASGSSLLLRVLL